MTASDLRTDRSHWPLWGLAVITAAGAVLRLYRLDYPPIWFDEAATYARVCGSWRELLDILRNDGFMPLHYYLYWLIGGQRLLNPVWMRIIPALTGVALIPTTYFLARQMGTSQAAGLTAAAFSAFGAYLLAFSRDAKMYMETWLFVGLFCGLLLWWLRRSSWGGLLMGWWLWALAGALAVWLHASALLIITPAPLVALAYLPKDWARRIAVVVILVIGLGLIAAGPAWYYTHFSEWNRRTGGFLPGAERILGKETPYVGNWVSSGLTWIPRFHEGRNGFQIARHSASSLLLGWEWPSDRELNEKGPTGQYIIPRWTFYAGVWVMSVLAVALLVGLLPWKARKEKKPLELTPAGTESSSVTTGATLPTVGWWKRAWAVGVWVLLPGYVLYARSVKDFYWPSDFLKAVWALWECKWLSVTGASLILAWLMDRQKWGLGQAVRWAVRGGLVVLVLTTLWLAIWVDWLWWLDVWPRLIGQSSWIVGTLCVLGLGWLWWKAGLGWRQRLIKAAQLTALIAAGAGIGQVLAWFLARAAAAAEAAGQSWQAVWWPRYLGVILPVLAAGIGALIMRLPGWFWRGFVLAVLIGANLLNGIARLTLDVDAPVDQIARDVYAAQSSDGRILVIGYQFRSGDSRVRPWRPENELRRLEGRYYFASVAGIVPSPHEMRSDLFFQIRVQPTPVIQAGRLREEITRRPKAERLIIWERYEPGPRPVRPKPDRWLERLGQEWRLERETLVRVRQHFSRTSREWNWQEREWLWRGEYVRQTATPAQEK